MESFLEVTLFDDNWTNLCKVWAKFRLCLSKVFVILSKFIENKWKNKVLSKLRQFFWNNSNLYKMCLGNLALVQILEGTLALIQEYNCLLTHCKTET